ncbi:MAG: MotA/TolQ/ExbB proton channel family protein, partial [Bacteroidota bacterium]
MRRFFAFILAMGLVVFAGNLFAQDTTTQSTTQPATDTAAPPVTAPAETAAPTTAATAEPATGVQMLKEKFIQGGWGYMLPILICMIIGLAVCIERIITLNLASVNTDKLLARIDDRLKAGDVNGAMEICKSTPGPTASVLFEGLRNAKYGSDASEKAIVSYGSVQMGLLEKGLVWISLVIAL